MTATQERPDESQFFIERVFMTSDLAEELLEANLNNRRLNPNQVRLYATSMVRNQWVENGDTICVSRTGRLLNGQHRLTAVVEAGRMDPLFKGVWMSLARNVDDNAITTIDIGRKRSGGDMFHFYGIPNGTDLSSMFTQTIAFDVGILMRSDVITSLILPDDRLAEYHSDADLARESVRNGKRVHAHLKRSRAGFMALYYLIERENRYRPEVDDFFEKLVTGAGLAADTPLLAFRNWLLNRDRIPAEVLLLTGLKVWAAHIKGSKMRICRPYTKDQEIPEVMRLSVVRK